MAAAFAGHPFARNSSYEVERTGDEDNVLGRGEFSCARQGGRRAGTTSARSGMMGVISRVKGRRWARLRGAS